MSDQNQHARLPALRPQSGVSGVLVLVAMAVLGGLASWAVGLSSATGASSAQALALARVQESATAGADWARWRLRVPAAPVCAATLNVVLPGVLGNMTVTTRCTLISNTVEGATPVRRWRVQVDACNQPLAGNCPAALPRAGYVQASLTEFVDR